MAFFALGTYFGLGSGGSRTRQVLAGLACGLAYGSKVYHLLGIVFITLIVAWECWRAASPGTARRLREATTGTVVFGGAVLAATSFWLVRNYLAFDNPFYPIYVGPIFDLLGWPPAVDFGDMSEVQFYWVRSPQEWLVYPWVEWHYARHFYNPNAGLGPYFASLVHVAVIFAAYDFVAVRPHGNGSPALPQRRMLLVLGALFVLAMWWLSQNRQPRYAQSALVFLLPLVGFLLTTSHGWARRVLEGVAAVSVLWMVFVIVSREGVEFGDRFLYSRHFQRHQYYEYPAALDDLPASSTLLNLADRFANYPLYGEGRDHKVISYLRAAHHFGDKERLGWNTIVENVYLTHDKLLDLGVTHVYVASKVRVAQDECVSLHEIDRLVLNPVSRQPYQTPRVLFEVKYCDGGQESRSTH